jgi:DNA-binding NarL/FixJ family response regulator
VGSEFVIVVATGRPSVGAFFTSLGARHPQAISTTTFDVSTAAVQGVSRAIVDAAVAVVDASLDPVEGLAVCPELRARRADLRIGVLFCCPHAATPESLRPFLAAGIGSFLDLQLSTEQMLAALRGIARGEDVFRLQLSEDSSTALFNGHSSDERLSEDDLALLRLVALGLSDREIGEQMCLSRHTIKHRIDRLRQRAQARNRIQLAAFAARLEREQGAGPHQHPASEP